MNRTAPLTFCILVIAISLIAPSSASAQTYTATPIASYTGCLPASWGTFTPGGDSIIMTGCVPAVRVWVPGRDSVASHYPDTVLGPYDRPYRVAFSRDGRRALSLGQFVIIWDVATWRPIQRITEKLFINGAVFSADGSKVITAGDEGVYAWDVESGRLVDSLWPPGRTAIIGMDLSPDGRTLVMSNDSGRIWTMSYPEGVPGWQQKRPAQVRSVQFSRDGHRILSASINDERNAGEAFEIDATTGERVRRFPGYYHSISSVRYSPDGDHIITTSLDSTVVLWSTRTGERVLTLPVGYRLNWGEISPDGRQMVTSGYNGTVLWDLQITSSVSSPETGVASDRLLQILPNPARDRVDVPFELARPGFARLSVVNALGVEVAAVVGREFGAGVQSVRLDLSGLESGAYWCVMRTERGRVSAPIRVHR